MINGMIQLETQFRGITQVNPTPNFTPEKAGSTLQARHRTPFLLLIADDTHLDIGILQIGRNFDLRDGTKLYPWILQASLNDVA
jgi:hypothetical protein